MADARDDGTQLVCTTEPACLCAGGEKYSCECSVGEVLRQCATCEALLIRINVDSGEGVEHG